MGHLSSLRPEGGWFLHFCPWWPQHHPPGDQDSAGSSAQIASSPCGCVQFGLRMFVLGAETVSQACLFLPPCSPHQPPSVTRASGWPVWGPSPITQDLEGRSTGSAPHHGDRGGFG